MIPCFPNSGMLSYYVKAFMLAIILGILGAMFWVPIVINSLRDDSTAIRQHGAAFQSKCSLKADSRGFHQKVVAYSLYGNFSHPGTINRYLAALFETSRTFPSRYPGWVMRIYHSAEDEITSVTLNNYFGEASDVADHVDLCNVNDIDIVIANPSMFESTWRFLPLVDDLVDIFASRDSDAVIITREMDAVREWLKSTQTFHVMRDHQFHQAKILAGMWGAKVHQQRDEIQQCGLQMLTREHSKNKEFDQQILAEIMWPLVEANLITHDSYCCSTFKSTKGVSVVRPFPNQRLGQGFIGNVVTESYPLAECPKECRPANHQNWTYC